MSYPQLLRDSNPKNDYVTFSVPNHRLVRKIVHDSEEEENLRIQVSGKALTTKIEELALLFSKYNLEASPIEGSNEMRVRLFVPPPPTYPPPAPPETPTPEPQEPKYVIYTPRRHKPSPRPRSETDRPAVSHGIGGDYFNHDVALSNYNYTNDFPHQRLRLTTIQEEEEEVQIDGAI